MAWPDYPTRGRQGQQHRTSGAAVSYTKVCCQVHSSPVEQCQIRPVPFQSHLEGKALYSSSSLSLLAAHCSQELQKPSDRCQELKQRLIQKWIEETRKTFPRLLSRSYITPPVWFNPVSFTEIQMYKDMVAIPKADPRHQESDVRGDESRRRVHNVLASMFEGKTEEVMVGMFPFSFDNYLNAGGTKKRKRLDDEQGMSTEPSPHPCLSKSGLSIFRRPRDLRGSLQRGEIDVLIVHRDLGLIAVEVKAVGDLLAKDSPGAQDVIRRRVKQSLKQLDRDAEVLHYILEDAIQEGVGITKVLMLPNLNRQTVRAALSEDAELVQKFCECFDSEALDQALDRCVFSDQLPPIGQAVGADDDVIHNLRRDWWIPLRSKITSRPMSESLYESVIARVCGPATKQYVHTARAPRAEVSRLSQAVLETSRCFTAQVLTEPQVAMVTGQEGRVLVRGPAGTGKRVMLLLKTQDWLRKGHSVVILSLWPPSHAAALCLYNQVKQEMTTERGKLLYVLNKNLRFDDLVTQLQEIRQGTFREDEPAQASSSLDSGFSEGVSADLNSSDEENDDQNAESMDSSEDDHQRSSKSEQSTDQHQKLHVVVTEAPYYLDQLLLILETLLGKDGFVIWVATSLPCPRLPDFSCFEVARNLRRPPAVVREMVKTPAYRLFKRVEYRSEDTGVVPDMPLPTDGPVVKRIEHQGHAAEHVWHCEACGEAVAAFLTEDLKIEATTSRTLTTAVDSALHFSDVLISGPAPAMDSSSSSSIQAGKQAHTQGTLYPSPPPPPNLPYQPRPHGAEPLPPLPGFLKGLAQRNVPFDVMDHDDVTSYPRLADPQSRDCVQVAEAGMTLGLERAVVVVVVLRVDSRETMPRYVDPLYDVMGCCTSQLVIVEEIESSLTKRA